MKYLAWFVAASVLVLPSLARADETARPRAEHWVDPVNIHAPPMRPLAVTELGRVLPSVKLAELRKPFVERIERATETGPF